MIKESPTISVEKSCKSSIKAILEGKVDENIINDIFMALKNSRSVPLNIVQANDIIFENLTQRLGTKFSSTAVSERTKNSLLEQHRQTYIALVKALIELHKQTYRTPSPVAATGLTSAKDRLDKIIAERRLEIEKRNEEYKRKNSTSPIRGSSPFRPTSPREEDSKPKISPKLEKILRDRERETGMNLDVIRVKNNAAAETKGPSPSRAVSPVVNNRFLRETSAPVQQGVSNLEKARALQRQRYLDPTKSAASSPQAAARQRLYARPEPLTREGLGLSPREKELTSIPAILARDRALYGPKGSPATRAAIEAAAKKRGPIARYTPSDSDNDHSFRSPVSPRRFTSPVSVSPRELQPNHRSPISQLDRMRIDSPIHAIHRR